MEFSKIRLDKRIFPLQHARIKRPSIRLKDVPLFELVQFTLRRKGRL